MTSLNPAHSVSRPYDILQTPTRDLWRAAVTPRRTPTERYWLTRPGALTAGLRGLGQVELSVLSEHAGGLTRDEAPAIGLPVGSPVWVREVIMLVDGIPAVVARSLTPLAASHGAWQGMRRLRTRPLADMLYHDAGVTRSAFKTRALDRFTPLHGTVHTAIAALAARSIATPWTAEPTPWLARRSVFRRLGQPLMVAECFLPSFWHRA